MRDTTVSELASHNFSTVLAASGLSSAATLALYALIAILAAVFVFLCHRILVTERAQRQAAHLDEETAPLASLDTEPLESIPALRQSPPRFAAAGGMLGVASEEATTCPACHTEFGADVHYCTHDARELIPSAAVSGAADSAGSRCPTCHRSYGPGSRYCPQDASQLIPAAVYELTRRSSQPTDTGVVAKVCSSCLRRYDMAATFCTNDGTELMILN